jgi:uncharacterized protein YndB with AHSA1/START domain
MTYRKGLFALVATVLVTASPVGQASGAGSGTELQKRLQRGDIVVVSKPDANTKMPRVKAIAVIDAPPETVWAVVSDCIRIASVLGNSKAERIVQAGQKPRCRVTVDMPFPLGELVSVTQSTHDVVPGRRWKSRWQLVAGDYRANDGGWTLEPFEGDKGRTLVVYEIHADPDIPVPASVIEERQKERMRNLIENLRSDLVTAAPARDATTTIGGR